MRTFNSFPTAAAAEAFIAEHAHHLDSAWSSVRVEQRSQGDWHVVLNDGEWDVVAAYITTPDPETNVYGGQDSTPETSESGRTLRFQTNRYGEVSAWVTAPEYPTEVLVGVFSTRPDFSHTWITQYDGKSSVRFPDLNREAWANIIRLVHLHR